MRIVHEVTHSLDLGLVVPSLHKAAIFCHSVGTGIARLEPGFVSGTEVICGEIFCRSFNTRCLDGEGDPHIFEDILSLHSSSVEGGFASDRAQRLEPIWHGTRKKAQSVKRVKVVQGNGSWAGKDSHIPRQLHPGIATPHDCFSVLSH